MRKRRKKRASRNSRMSLNSSGIFGRSDSSSSNIFGINNTSTLSFRAADHSEFREDMKFGYIAKTRIDDMFDDFHREYYTDECPNVNEEIAQLRNFHENMDELIIRKKNHHIPPLLAGIVQKKKSSKNSLFLTQGSRTKGQKFRSKSQPAVNTESTQPSQNDTNTRTIEFETDNLKHENKDYQL